MYAACALNFWTRKGLTYLGSVDDSTLTDFIHTYFGGDDSDYESPGKILTLSVKHSLVPMPLPAFQSCTTKTGGPGR